MAAKVRRIVFQLARDTVRPLSINEHSTAAAAKGLRENNP
jgi:hypothetical protein